MATTNASAGTNVQEIAEGVYRINTPVDLVPGGFSFNQYLIVDDQPPAPQFSDGLCHAAVTGQMTSADVEQLFVSDVPGHRTFVQRIRPD